jgi:hypothetical protein
MPPKNASATNQLALKNSDSEKRLEYNGLRGERRPMPDTFSPR